MWKMARDDKIKSIKLNNIGSSTNLPPNNKTTHKAGLVAKKYCQKRRT